MIEPILAVDASMYLAASIAGAISITGIFVNRYFSKRQDVAEARAKEADASATFTDTALRLIAPLKEQIYDLQKQIADMEVARMADESIIRELTEKIESVERWAKLLYVQIIEFGETPLTFEESEMLHETGS